MTAVDIGRAVDWKFAADIGGRLARPGPPISDYTRDQVTDELSECARIAEPLVREVTGLAADTPVPDARIVDRIRWIAAAAESMRALTGGTEQSRQPRPSGGLLTRRVTGAQLGALLAFVSSGILGQYDPFNGGCLLLVYPNVIAVERQLRVPPSDFRLWVCLHEVTHRVQFDASPWLTDYMLDALAELTTDSGERIGNVVGRLFDHLRGRRDAAGGAAEPTGLLGLVRVIQSETQQQALDRLLMLGTLLEGHADYVMDAAGPRAVPSVQTIRTRFDQRRRRKQPPPQRLVRALIGMDAKLSQYTRGRAFVDDVVGRVGMQRFNAVWARPDALPLPTEIDEPQRWIDRVL